MPIRYCTNCGNKLEEGARFCGECGAEIPMPVEKVEVNKKLNKKPPYIAFAIAGVAIVAVVATVVYTKISKSSSEKTVESDSNLGQEYLDVENESSETTEILSENIKESIIENNDEETVVESSEDEQIISNEKMIEAYYGVLSGIYNDRVWADGSEVMLEPSELNSTDNTFAIYDIDLDGMDELIILMAGTSMANANTVVYGYDESTDTVYKECDSWIYTDFYNDGTVITEYGQKGGYGEYRRDIYKYDAINDIYNYKGWYDEYDLEVFLEYGTEDFFPYEGDTDGNGLTYCIYDLDYNFDGSTYVDDNVYEEWLKTWDNNNKKIIQINNWEILSEYKSIIE
jgi:predicted nucleic acid-binding Zn ribbon protein